MKTIAILLCAGEATRWSNYLNSPKHLINIEGERLLDRTTRLIKEAGIDDIYVVTKEYDERYDTNYSKQEVVKVDYEANADADKFLSSKHLWNKEGRTIVFYGDCYFTEEAIRRIVNFKSEEWTLFCRPTASIITGCPYGECFAQSFYPKDLKEHEEMLHYIAQLWKDKVITRCGGWEHYRAMTGRRDKKVRHPHIMTTNYEIIDDFSEDFDTPDDYENWYRNRAKFLSRK